MGKIGKCCCGTCPTLAELPDIVIAGMTPTSDWTNFGGNACCWERTYTYNTTQEFDFLYEDVIDNYDFNMTSVVEWLKYKQTPFLRYKLSMVPCEGVESDPLNPDAPVAEDCLEECPGGPQPDPYDCGTYVKVATTTTTRIDQAKSRRRFYIKKRDIRIRITKGDVSCDETPLEKWVVQIRYRFWSRIGSSSLSYQSTNRNTVFETCFSGGMPIGWGNTSTSTGSPSYGFESTVDTEQVFTKTKTYTTLPSTETWNAADANSSDCYNLCEFDANMGPSITLQAYVAPVNISTCSPTITSQSLLSGYTLDPCVLPSISNCSFVECIDCNTSPPTISRSPGPTIDCSAASYNRFIVSANSCTINVAVTALTPAATINYTCDSCFTSLACADIPEGWYQGSVGENCKYIGAAFPSQQSLSLTYIDVEKRDLVTYSWPSLFVDFNL
jgi:hypothetical protein